MMAYKKLKEDFDLIRVDKEREKLDPNRDKKLDSPNILYITNGNEAFGDDNNTLDSKLKSIFKIMVNSMTLAHYFTKEDIELVAYLPTVAWSYREQYIDTHWLIIKKNLPRGFYDYANQFLDIKQKEVLSVYLMKMKILSNYNNTIDEIDLFKFKIELFFILYDICLKCCWDDWDELPLVLEKKWVILNTIINKNWYTIKKSPSKEFFYEVWLCYNVKHNLDYDPVWEQLKEDYNKKSAEYAETMWKENHEKGWQEHVKKMWLSDFGRWYPDMPYKYHPLHDKNCKDLILNKYTSQWFQQYGAHYLALNREKHSFTNLVQKRIIYIYHLMDIYFNTKVSPDSLTTSPESSVPPESLTTSPESSESSVPPKTNYNENYSYEDLSQFIEIECDHIEIENQRLQDEYDLDEYNDDYMEDQDLMEDDNSIEDYDEDNNSPVTTHPEIEKNIYNNIYSLLSSFAKSIEKELIDKDLREFRRPITGDIYDNKTHETY